MSEDYEVKIKKIARIFLESEKKMIKRMDLLAFVHDSDLLDEMISDLLDRFEQLGYDMITTRYLNEIYYVLTSPGVDKNLTPIMYGALAIILALNREFGKDIEINRAQELFDDIWNEIEFMIENGYLDRVKIKNEELLVITPAGKAIFKNIITDLDINQIMKNLSKEK